MTNIKDYCRRCGKRTGDDATSVHTCTPNPVIEALENELAECRKDAERYRWLKKVSVPKTAYDRWEGTMHQLPNVHDPKEKGMDYALDAAIDAAIGESK